MSTIFVVTGAGFGDDEDEYAPIVARGSLESAQAEMRGLSASNGVPLEFFRIEEIPFEQ